MQFISLCTTCLSLFFVSQVDVKTKIKQEKRDNVDKGQEDGYSRETDILDKTCLDHSKLKADSLEGMSKTLSLQVRASVQHSIL